MNVSPMNAPVAVNKDSPVDSSTMSMSSKERIPSAEEQKKAKDKTSNDKDKTKSKTKAKSKSSSSSLTSQSKPKSRSTTATISKDSTAEQAVEPKALPKDKIESPASKSSAVNEKQRSEEPSIIEDTSENKDSTRIVEELTADVEDEEVRLAMEMALAAAQNPKLSAAEIRDLVGKRNKQVQIVDEFSQKKKQAIERKKQEEIEEAQKRWDEKKEIAINWWQAKSMAVKETAAQITEAAVKRAEEMKLNAEMRLYSDQIKNDIETNETRKKIKVLKKIYKAHRLQGNRVETRHLFKRQRMEKRLIQIFDKLGKTERLLTHSSYNVQEYLKAIMRASKKWRKKGNDEELMLEAQLCRNMHQMLALEKQKVKCKKSQREMKKYLQRCKGWLVDKKAFCEMNQMTLEATMHSMKVLYEDIIAKQDQLIEKLKASDEYKNVDLSDVDTSNLRLPTLPSARAAERSAARDAERSAALNAMKGLPMNDSIRMKKEASVKSGEHNHNTSASQLQTSRRELYVTAKDDVSVCSGLSDPDEPFNNIEYKSEKYVSNEDSDSHFNFGNDAPWMTSASSLRSTNSDKKSISNESTNLSPIIKAMTPPDPIEEEDETDTKPSSKQCTGKIAVEKNTNEDYDTNTKAAQSMAQHKNCETDIPQKRASETSDGGDSFLAGELVSDQNATSNITRTSSGNLIAPTPVTNSPDIAFAYSANSNNYVSSDDEDG